VGYRWNSSANVMEGLRRAGPKAVEDYERAMEHRKKQGPIPGRIKIDDECRSPLSTRKLFRVENRAIERKSPLHRCWPKNSLHDITAFFSIPHYGCDFFCRLGGL